MSYQFGALTFTTKEAVGDYARQIKDHHKPGDMLAPDEFQFMVDLLARHPDAAEKIGKGVKAIIIRSNPKFGHNEFYLIRVDGTATDFSYKQCLSPYTPEADFKTALRVAIAPDIVEAQRRFLAVPNAYCAFTGERLTRATAHVDHQPPDTFKRLVEEFVRLHRLVPSQVPLTGRNQDNSFTIRLADPELEQQWIEFHRSKAKLRLVSAQANLEMVGKDWDIILEYLQSTGSAPVLVNYKGKTRFYGFVTGVHRGVLLGADKAPSGTPAMDGSLALIEMSLKGAS